MQIPSNVTAAISAITAFTASSGTGQPPNHPLSNSRPLTVRWAQRGVTLVEAAVVMAISAITVSTAAPSFAGLIEKQRLVGVAAQLATDVQFVRAESILRNTPVRLSFHTQIWGSCYVAHTGQRSDCECNPEGVAICSGDAQQIKTVRLPADDRIGLQSNVTSILFDPLHGTSTPTGTLKVVAQSGSAIHHIVNIMGRVRSCSPQGSTPAVAGFRAC